jgi:hypothetical protein
MSRQRTFDASIVSSRKSNNLKPPVHIHFSQGWNSGEIFDWYRGLGATTIDSLQLHREYEEPFRHQFLLVALRESSKCYRFERRQISTELTPLDALTPEGTVAFDTVQVLPSRPANALSECLLDLRFKCEIDLKFILAVCYGIHRDEAAQKYTLQRFNCYFFAWSITSCLARYAESWQTPSSEMLSRVLSEIEGRHSVFPPDIIGWLRTESSMLHERTKIALRQTLWWDSLKDELRDMIREAAKERTLFNARQKAKNAATKAAWHLAHAASASAFAHASRYAAPDQSNAAAVWAKAWFTAWVRAWEDNWDISWGAVPATEWDTTFDSAWYAVWDHTKRIAWEKSWEMAWGAVWDMGSQAEVVDATKSDAKSAAMGEIANVERHATRNAAKDAARNAIGEAARDAAAVSYILTVPLADAVKDCQSHDRSGCKIDLVSETGMKITPSRLLS